jgi:transcriptional regulator with XRE-family HTH domain
MKNATLNEFRLDIISKISRLRRERGWSQKNFAQLLGLSQSRFSQIERGQGSFTAEQLFILVQNFNLSYQFFSSKKRTSLSVLQNAIVRLGASNLQESKDSFPSERLEKTVDVVREVLISAESPRQIVGIAPVLVHHVEDLGFYKLKFQLAEHGLDMRLAWVIENTMLAIQAELSRPLSKKDERRYKKVEILLNRHLSAWNKIEKDNSQEEDILDRDILSEKTIEQVRTASSKTSKKWKIITRIQVQDFIEALRASHGIN